MGKRGPKRSNVLASVGEHFTTKDGVVVTLVDVCDDSLNPLVVVTDDEGNKRSARYQQIKHGRLNWRRKSDGRFKPSRLDLHGPPLYRRRKDLPVEREVAVPAELPPLGYYVYVASINGEVVYVGKGKGKRWLHCFSGRSNNKELNRAYFSDAPMIVEIWQDSLSNEDASELERQMISYFKPRFNLTGNPEWVKVGGKYVRVDQDTDEIEGN